MTIEYNPPPKSLNGKQFSQLALFHMKPEGMHRWPEGYTPERMDEVSAQVRGRVYSEVPEWPEARAEKFVAQTVARSHTPVSDLKETVGPQRHVQDAVQLGSKWNPNARLSAPGRVEHRVFAPKFLLTQKLPDNVAGNYSAAHTPSTRSLNPLIRVRPDGLGIDPEYTLLHELGHHRSLLESKPHSDWEDPANQTRTGDRNFGGSYPTGNVKGRVAGAEEAFADRNAEERLVRRKNDSRSVIRPTDYSPSGYNTQRQFQSAFRDEYAERYGVHRAAAYRKWHDAQPAQVAKATAWHREMTYYSGTNVPTSQGMLFRRSADQSKTQAGPDYGQHPLYAGAEEHAPSLEPVTDGPYRDTSVGIGTIKVGRGVR